jgi:alkylation response protein AidB-like acyl-CoA dehydrogenase
MDGAMPDPVSNDPGDYLARIREIAPDLAAAGDEIDRRRELPAAIVAALVDRGLFRLLLPRSLGGAELLPAQYVPIVEQLAMTAGTVF